MSALKSTLSVFLLICFLSCSVSEDLQLQPIKEITVRPGDDVTLPCRAPNNVTISAVEWIRSDLDRYVYLKEDGRLNTTDQDPSYVNRVQLKDDEMKNGDLSLILNNLNNNDEGRYECLYVEERGGAVHMKLISIVYLDVKDQQETAQPGDDVTLTCEAPNNVIIRAVEWIRSGLDPDRYVYLKSDGHLNTANQDPSYVNRVQLRDDEMKNGELSLILKNVNNNDGGTYLCLYVEKRGRRRKRADQSKLGSIVHLNVEDGDSEDEDSGVTLLVTLNVVVLVAVVGLLAAVGLVCFVTFKKRKGGSENKSDLPVDDPDVFQQLQENENSQKNITNNISDTQV